MAAKELPASAFKFVVFLGTVRENNYGSRAAKFMVKKLKDRGFQVTLLDHDEIDIPILKKPYHFYQDKSQAPEILQKINKQIVEADGYVLVTAEYNHCLPPALLNLIDHFPGSSFKYRPASIVCYSAGQYGGVRAAMQARCLLGEIGCPSTSFLFAIPQVQNSFNEDGVPTNDRMETGADKLIDELEWYARAIRNHRDSFGKPAK